MNDELSASVETEPAASIDSHAPMSALDQKINEHFAGKVVRKDLVKAVQGNAIVPSYVLEYLLGQYARPTIEASIEAGIETVKEILASTMCTATRRG